MYQISVEDHFDAAHFLRDYKGKCEALHGHRFRAVVTVKVPWLDNVGIAYDFTDLKQYLASVLARFDHTCLNDVPPFDQINPTSENLATTIYSELQSKLAGAPVSISCVEVWESPQSRAAYTPD